MEEQNEIDVRMMREALKEAQRAARDGEVPIGAVLVQDGRVVARGRNQVESLCDATAHAEMLCVTSGAAALGNWRLLGCTLYCTLEPCPMCFGAMTLSRLPRLVYGAPDRRHGACGSWVDLQEARHPIHQMEVVKGVESEAAADLLIKFFRLRREQGRSSRDPIWEPECDV
ncbi:MAG: tRNA adenosine(34) deaminase TadA [Chlamydiia bacterium]